MALDTIATRLKIAILILSGATIGQSSTPVCEDGNVLPLLFSYLKPAIQLRYLHRESLLTKGPHTIEMYYPIFL